MADYTGPIKLCPQCKKEGLTSAVYVGCVIITDMWCSPFYDKEGRLHNHDMNFRSQDFECSRGHVWQEDVSKHCWCGWPDSGPYVEETDGEIDGRAVPEEV